MVGPSGGDGTVAMGAVVVGAAVADVDVVDVVDDGSSLEHAAATSRGTTTAIARQCARTFTPTPQHPVTRSLTTRSYDSTKRL